MELFTELRRRNTSRLLKKSFCRLVKKISEARRTKNRRTEAHLGGTLERLRLERNDFRGDERDNSNRQLSAGWRHMSLFQQPARESW